MSDADESVKRVEIARKDNLVILTMQCVDHYAAMLVYDQVAAELAAGFVRIDITPKQRVG